MGELKIESEAIIEVVGTQYEGREENHENLEIGQKLKLERVPNNKYDENAIMIKTLNGKELGFIPKGQAGIYAPAIDSGKYVFDVEVLDSYLSDSRPILLVKLRADYKNLNEEAVLLEIHSFLQYCVNSVYHYRDSFNACISDEYVDVEDVIKRLNNARLYNNICIAFDDLIQEYSVEKNRSEPTPYSKEMLIDKIKSISTTIAELLKKLQRLSNKLMDIDDEDEYRKAQDKMYEKRKKFKKINEYFQKATESIENYTPLIIENGSPKNNSELKNVTEPPTNKPVILLGKDEVIADIDCPDKYIGTSPIYFIYNQKRYTVKTWRAVYTSFISLLYNEPEYRSILVNLIDSSIFGNPNLCPDFATLESKRFLRRRYGISDDFFVEINFSTQDILKRIRKLIEICKLSPTDLKIVCNDNAEKEYNDDLKSDIEKIISAKNEPENNDSASEISNDSEKKDITDIEIEELIIAVMQSDDERVNSFRNGLYGLNPESVQKLIYELYNVSVDEYSITKCLIINNKFCSVGKNHYILRNNNKKKDSSDEKTAVSESQTNSEDISLMINGKTYRVADITDALCKICEFAIRVKSFMMARIPFSHMQIKGKEVFRRNSVNLQGYRKLSNNLQVVEISSSDELKTLSHKILSYCNINENMIKID